LPLIGLPCIIHRFNAFGEPIWYDTLFTFIVSYHMIHCNVTMCATVSGATCVSGRAIVGQYRSQPLDEIISACIRWSILIWFLEFTPGKKIVVDYRSRSQCKHIRLHRLTGGCERVTSVSLFHAVRLSFKTRVFHPIIKHAWSGASFVTRVGKCISDNGLRPRRDLGRYIRARACGGGDRWGERKCIQDDV